MKPPTILLVESEPTHREALAAFLQREGFEVCAVRTGVEALAGCPVCVYDLVLLDAALPDLSGVEVCRRLRAKSVVPIIMVTSGDHGQDPALALEVGADDCMVKPVRLRELLARVRAQLRRAAANGTETPRPVVLKVGKVRLDAGTGSVVVDGRRVHLPRKEFALLAILLADHGQVVRRDLIMGEVWGSDWGNNSKTLDAHIKRLRERLEETGAEAQITTIRGLGYRYESLESGAEDEVVDVAASEGAVVIDLDAARGEARQSVRRLDEVVADQP